ncbi:hypothetical protein [Spiroplasma endosymbiont of Polydrusus pterygomalis]|uniref:hypothetical protein n=1 Tax=Spiroplasma endosymbiont of Polydrusus pterygomalis TaxID=3139327 RepID=UPI003CCB6988
MINNEIYEKIVSISFVIAIMIMAIGWLGVNKNKKRYLILWIGVIPIIISCIFLFFTKNYYHHILLILILSFSYLIYIGFLIVSTCWFIKIKRRKEINQQVEKTFDSIKNNNL